MARSRIVRLDTAQQFTAINVLSDPGYDPNVRTIPSCVEVRLDFALESGKVGHMVLHARYGTGFTPSTAIATAIWQGLSSGTAWTALAAFLATSTNFGNVVLRDLNAANQPFVPGSATSAPGTSASPAMPNEVAAVITLRTGQVGPAFRGRMYVPGWATNALGAGNVIAAAAVTALSNWANTIPSVLTGQGLQFAIGQHSRLAYTGVGGREHPARNPATVLITSQTVRDNHWDTQRRRGLK
jgi:hypothetical protein